MSLPGELSARALAGVAEWSAAGDRGFRLASAPTPPAPCPGASPRLDRLDEVEVVLAPNGDGQPRFSMRWVSHHPTHPSASAPVAWTGLEGLSVQVDDLC